MEKIVLEVDDSVGRIYENFSNESKQQFSLAVSLMLKKAVNDATFAEYSRQLDESANEAIKNGLTPEILETLLASND